MAALDTRIVAAELKTNTAALKATVDALKTSVDAVHAQTDAFVVDSVDGDLPAELAVQAALTDYDALSVTISKPTNSLNDSLAVIRAAE